MRWAARYVGIPFKALGRDRAGCDCWGLVRLVLAEQFGIAVPSYDEDYATVHDRREIMALRNRELPSWREVAPTDAAAGDVVALRIEGQPTHYGVVVERGLMLHAHEGTDACAERYDGPLWRHRVVGVYRRAPASEEATCPKS